MSNRIVILGGGAGGIVVANKLRKALPKHTEIVLVDKELDHIFYPSLLWLMVGEREANQIQKPLLSLEKKGINFLNALVQKIDFENRTVLTSKGDVTYDCLIIALGANTYPEKIPGFSEAAYNLYDLSGAERLREAISDFGGGRVVVLISSTPFKCPAAPYEAALILSSYFKQREKNVEIEVVTPEKLPMPTVGPEIGKKIVFLLQSNGIKFTPEHNVNSINPEKKEIEFQNGRKIFYDLLIGIPPHGLPPVLQDSPISGRNGWVKVDPRTLETDFENVYAIGDITEIPLPNGKFLPKAGVFAHFQAEVVAHNIAAKIKGESGVKEFEGKGYCFIELGDGRAGYASGNFYSEPEPTIKMRNPSMFWHWGKALFEKWWLWKWF